MPESKLRRNSGDVTGVGAGTRATEERTPPSSVSFISWSEDSGRAEEIAGALGGSAWVCYDLGIVRRPLVPIRYALSAIRTMVHLASRRPRGVIVTNPPIFPGLIAMVYARVTGSALVLDSHPSAFADTAVSKALMPVHAWLARRAVTTLVTVDELARVVRSWGGRADIVHEAPLKWKIRPASPVRDRPQVLYIGRFAPDEPTAEVVEAARLTPEIDFRVTGDERKCPLDLRASAPSNLYFTGFLRNEEFHSALEAADVVLVLTNHPRAVNRGACEAVYARRPLVVSDLPAMTPLFPYAIHVRNDASGIAAGVRSAVNRHAELVAAAPQALGLQVERWRRQLETLSSRLANGGRTPRRVIVHSVEHAQ
jgi:glycosyltransferase involved in cell wall biosynthesis